MTIRAIFDIALKTFMFLSPIFLFRDYQTSFARGMFFVLGTFALFGISLGLEQKRKFSNPWLALVLIWSFILIFIRNDFGVSSEWFNFWISTAGFIYVFIGILLFYIVYCYAEDPKNYLTPILIVCAMNFILVIAQLTGHDFIWTQAPSLSGFMEISSQLGQYSAMSIPIAFFINPYFAIVPLIALFLSKSISSIVAFFIGITFLYRDKKYTIALILGIGLVLGAFNHQYILSRWQCRPVMWKKTLKAITQRPYIGHGYRSFNKVVVNSKAVATIGGREFSRPHNDPLHTAQEMGIISMIFIGGFFIDIFKKFKAKQNKHKLTYFLATSILIALINTTGQTFIRYASVAGTLIILVAFLSIKIQGGDHGYN